MFAEAVLGADVAFDSRADGAVDGDAFLPSRPSGDRQSAPDAVARCHLRAPAQVSRPFRNFSCVMAGAGAETEHRNETTLFIGNSPE